MNQRRSTCVTVRGFSPSDRDAFVSLNLDWIQEYFVVEDCDREQLERLDDSVLNRGGQIVVAELDQRVVGAGALVPPHHSPSDGRQWLELIKMATEKEHRGIGIGRAVLGRLLCMAREMDADGIWLETNSAMKAATHLYLSSGFRHLSPSEWWPTPYERCNLQMVLEL